MNSADTEHASEPTVPSQPALLSSGEDQHGESQAPAAVRAEASTAAGSVSSNRMHSDTTPAESALHPVRAGVSSHTAAPGLAHVRMDNVLGTELEQPGSGTPAHQRSADTGVPAARSTPELMRVRTSNLPGGVASRLLDSQSSTPTSHRLSDTGSEDCDEVMTFPGRQQGNPGSCSRVVASAHGTPR